MTVKFIFSREKESEKSALLKEAKEASEKANKFKQLALKAKKESNDLKSRVRFYDIMKYVLCLKLLFRFDLLHNNALTNDIALINAIMY